MTCQQVNEYLDRHSLHDWVRLPGAIRKHLDSCACCRGLWELLSRRPQPEAVPVEVRSRIEQDLLDTLEPVTPLASPGKLAAGFGLIWAGFSVLFAVLLASPEAPGIRTFWYGLVALFAAKVGVMLAIVLSREMSPGEKRLMAPAALNAASFFGMLAFVAIAFSWQLDEPFWGLSWKCFQAAFLLSIPAAALIVLLLRRGVVFAPPLAGAASGVLAGLVGVLALHFSCPHLGAPHIIMGHVTVPIAGGAIGYAVGRMVPVRWSARESAGAASEAH